MSFVNILELQENQRKSALDTFADMDQIEESSEKSFTIQAGEALDTLTKVIGDLNMSVDGELVDLPSFKVENIVWRLQEVQNFIRGLWSGTIATSSYMTKKSFDWESRRPQDRLDPRSPHYEGPEAGEWSAHPMIEAYLDVNYILDDAFYYEDAKQRLENFKTDEFAHFVNGVIESGEIFDQNNPLWPYLADTVRKELLGKTEDEVFRTLKHLAPMIRNIEDFIDVSDYPIEEPDRDPPDLY